jgi:hypothetical protein
MDKLIYLRNPWAIDNFNGTYSQSSNLSAWVLSQIPPSYLVENDGYFLVNETEFKQNFPVLEISRRINQSTSVSTIQNMTSPMILAQHTLKLTPM